MIENPILTTELAKSRYEEMLQEAAYERRAGAYAKVQTPANETNVLSNWLNELRFWSKSKSARRATTRA